MKCKQCGKNFIPKRSGQFYCSKECCGKHYREGQKNGFEVYKFTCPVCLEEFSSTNPQRRFCSPECANEYQDIAQDVLKRKRPLIKKMLEKLKHDPTLDIDKLIRKEYPNK